MQESRVKLTRHRKEEFNEPHWRTKGAAVCWQYKPSRAQTKADPTETNTR